MLTQYLLQEEKKIENSSILSESLLKDVIGKTPLNINFYLENFFILIIEQDIIFILKFILMRLHYIPRTIEMNVTKNIFLYFWHELL